MDNNNTYMEEDSAVDTPTNHIFRNDIDSKYLKILGITLTKNEVISQEHIEKALREKNMTLAEFLSSLQTTVVPLVTGDGKVSTTSPAETEGVSLGLILPIVLIGAFLIVVAFCIYWHSFRRKRRKSNQETTFARSFNYVHSPCRGVDYVRASTSSARSTTPLHASSIREKVNVIPLNDKTSERFHFYWDKDNWKLVPPDAVGHHTRGVPLGLRHQLSPIDEMDTPRSAELFSNEYSKSYEVTAQAPFSPYRLTWITPQAPPPSYEESEISSLSKCHTRPSEINTTRTTDETCSACNHRGKEINSPFFPNNNTPTTEYELASEQGTLHINMLAHSAGVNISNSQCSSYPSSPRSSSSESLTTSNIDRGVDASLMTSYPETSYPQSSFHSSYHPPYNSERTSVVESDTGIPSLPSSILFYHQKMTANNNNNNIGDGSKYKGVFSQYAYDNSLASSIESDENYTDNTSMLPNVGSAATSENRSSTQNSQLIKRNETSQNQSPEDLSKIVNELSSIRPCSNEPVSIDRGIVNSAMVFDGAVGQSYVNDVFAPQNEYCSTRDQNFRQSMTELFRSWSVTAELDYSSLSSRGGNSMQTPQNEESFSWDNYPWHRNREGQMQDINHNIIDLNKIPIPGRRVQFDVPVLVDKTYWV